MRCSVSRPSGPADDHGIAGPRGWSERADGPAGAGPTPDQPGQVIASLSAAFRARPAWLAAVLYAPATVLARLLTSCAAAGAAPGAAPGAALIDAWIALCWTAEGAWEAIGQGLPVAAGYGAGDTDLLRPLAARLRFLVLSEPMRWRGQLDGAWWAWEPDEIFGASGVLDRTLGERSWGLLVSRCQEARRLWQQCLDEYQSHPMLSQARPAELEQELNALVFTGSARRAPLILSVRPLADQAGPTAADKNVADEVTDRHLLPRFDLAGVLAHPGCRSTPRPPAGGNSWPAPSRRCSGGSRARSDRLRAGSSCFRLGAADQRGIRTLSPGENPGRTAAQTLHEWLSNRPPGRSSGGEPGPRGFCPAVIERIPAR